MNTNKAVKLAFPKLKPQTRQIIADWYDNEDASDDFDNLRDYAEHIKFDLIDMIWAATDATEVKAVKDDLVACGYERADEFPEDEDDEQRNEQHDDYYPEFGPDYKILKLGQDGKLVDVEIVKYRGNGGDVVIPDGITTIGCDSFANCDSLTSVVVPDSVKKIQIFAFGKCSNLKQISVPASLKQSLAKTLAAAPDTIPDTCKIVYRKSRRLNESTKVTLTFGQLKRLVKEVKIKDRNNNSITVDDSQLTIILKGTEESRNVNRSGFCRKMWVFHSLNSAVKFCDKTHIGCDGVETIIVHNKGKTEERGPFFDGEVMGTTNNWDRVKKIIETLVNEIKD